MIDLIGIKRRLFPGKIVFWRKLFTLGLIIFMFSSCKKHEIHLLPGPEAIISGTGYFSFGKKIYFSSTGTSTSLDNYVTELLQQGSVSTAVGKPNFYHRKITLEVLKSSNDLGDEGYILDIRRRSIRMQANTDRGIFYAVQTLKQILPPGFFQEGNKDSRKIQAPCVRIEDRPKYAWRGFLLDTGRQYHTPEFIKQFIDMLALFKINVFHWHLTENDGWRIASERYPKLHEVGGFVADGPQQHGYYTRAELIDIVEYARYRYIDIMPEIDLPGHADAALTAYPEYSCFGKPPVKTVGHSPHLFCGGNEASYAFLKEVIDEVCEIFPFAFIHLGGDEAPKDHWDQCPRCQAKITEQNLKNSQELQQYFSNRLAEHLIRNDRISVFWEDVLDQGNFPLPDETVIQWWRSRGRNDLGMQQAFERGLRVIASPNNFSYLNYPEVPWRGYMQNRTFDLETVYTSNPAHIENPDPLLLGITTCLWTDYNLTMDMISDRVFPRFLALAEQKWSQNPLPEYEEFLKTIEVVLNKEVVKKHTK